MVKARGKKMPIGYSAYQENKVKINELNTLFKKQEAEFCIYKCPHKDKPCGNNTCLEYRECMKKLREKYKNFNKTVDKEK